MGYKVEMKAVIGENSDYQIESIFESKPFDHYAHADEVKKRLNRIVGVTARIIELGD